MAVGSKDKNIYEKINENILKAENELDELFKGLAQNENRKYIAILQIRRDFTALVENSAIIFY